MQKKTILFFFLYCYIPTAIGNHHTFHRYFWASYNHASGNHQSAHDWYKIVGNNYHSLSTDKGYLFFLFDTKQYAHIAALIPSLEKKFEKDAEVQLLFVIALEKNNQASLADNKLLSICSSFKNNADITLRATQAYIQRKEPENALLTVDAFLNNNPRKPNNFIFYYIKTQIYIQLQKYPQALESIITCLDMHPHFDKGWLLHATLHEQQGKLQEAITGYTTFLELSGTHPLLQKHLTALIFRNKQTISFNKSYLDHALSLFEKKQYSQALTILSQLFKQDQTNEEAQSLNIKILAHAQQYEQLEKFCAEQLKQKPHNNKDIPQTIHMLSYSEIPRSPLISLLKKLALNDNNYWLPLYAADLCMRNSQTVEAIPLLEQSIAAIEDKKLKAQVHHQLALLHYEQEQYDAMLSHLEQGYTCYPTLAHLNNSLAYYWATKGKDITKAKTFLNAALNSERTNPYFIDTQATIYYKEKKYEKAQQLLEQGAQKNSSCLLRLAKIHYTLNNKEKSLAYVKQAALSVQNAPEKKRLHKLQERLGSHD